MSRGLQRCTAPAPTKCGRDGRRQQGYLFADYCPGAVRWWWRPARAAPLSTPGQTAQISNRVLPLRPSMKELIENIPVPRPVFDAKQEAGNVVVAAAVLCRAYQVAARLFHVVRPPYDRQNFVIVYMPGQPVRGH